MRIKVLNEIEETIEFGSSIGNAIGQCYEKNLKEGISYDVELDINVVLKLGMNVEQSSVNNLSFMHDGDFNWINGLVESIDEDDIICLRLANNCIIMVKHEDSKIKVGDFLLLRISKQDLEITLIGYRYIFYVFCFLYLLQ